MIGYNNISSTQIIMLPSTDPKYAKLREKWTNEQNDLRKQVIIKNVNGLTMDNLKLIGGLDISFVKNTNKACVSLVVLNYPDLTVLYEDYDMIDLEYPYMAQYLAFREYPAFAERWEKLKKNHPELIPQVILIDGNGIHHPRLCGSACHFGVMGDVATIGVAKNLLYSDGLTRERVKEMCDGKLIKGGDTVDLIGDSGERRSVALRTTDNAKNWVYVSPGHKLDVDLAAEIVAKCCQNRIPEPIRQADLRSRQKVREYEQKCADNDYAMNSFDEYS